MTYALDARVREYVGAAGAKEKTQDQAIAEVEGKAASAQRAAGKTPMDFGADGTGGDDTPGIQSFAQDIPPAISFLVASAVPVASGAKLDFKRSRVLKSTAANYTMLEGPASGVVIENVTLDMARDTLGNAPGHGVSINGSRNVARNVNVLNYGSDGTGGGSSVRFGAGKLNRIEGGEHVADPTAAINIGWLYSTVDFSWVRDVYVSQVHQGIAYAHELKNDSAFNHMSGLLTENSKHGLVYGQDTGTGPHHNVAMGVVNGGVDRAFYTGFSHENLVVGLLQDTTDRPALTSIRLVALSASDRNAVHAAHISGPSSDTDRLVVPDGNDNYVGASLHSLGRVYYPTNAKRNFTEVHHPGARSSILPSIEDASDGSNVTHSPASGERVGSLSGRFLDRLGTSGVDVFGVPLSSYNWVKEAAASVIEAVLTPNDQSAGMAHFTPAEGRVGAWGHFKSAGEWFWQLRTAATDILRFYANRIEPRVTGMSLGTSSRKFQYLYANQLRLGPDGVGGIIWTTGAGSPEGVLAAPVGSMFTRTDGGAGTTLYVKETGSEATGWVAK